MAWFLYIKENIFLGKSIFPTNKQSKQADRIKKNVAKTKGTMHRETT